MEIGGSRMVGESVCHINGRLFKAILYHSTLILARCNLLHSESHIVKFAFEIDEAMFSIAPHTQRLAFAKEKLF